MVSLWRLILRIPSQDLAAPPVATCLLAASVVLLPFQPARRKQVGRRVASAIP
jgi:hypothetical protein